MTTTHQRPTPSAPRADTPAALPERPIDPVAAGFRIPISARARPGWVLTTLADAMDAPSAAAGPANVVMQLLHAPVAYGVMESKVEGSLYKHPVRRTRTTFTYLAVALLGTDADRVRYREAVDAIHRMVRSGPASPVKYNGFDRDLQLWVAMCLYVGFEDTHQLLRGRMSREQRAVFYADSAPLGTSLQVHPDQWPATPEDFDARWVQLCRTNLDPTDDSREYLRRLVDLTFVPLVPGRARTLSRFLTAGFLAPAFRAAMGIEYTAADQRRFDIFWRVLAAAVRPAPLALRRLPYRLLLTDMRTRRRLGIPMVSPPRATGSGGRPAGCP